MRRFHCQRCEHPVEFADRRCRNCDSPLGFVLELGRLIVVAADDGALLRAPFDPQDQRYWRCLNAAWGCNWLVPAEVTGSWCGSCRLTRGRPDDSNTDAVLAWVGAEAAKRLLVFQLHGLGLPIRARTDGEPDGLAFDLVYVPGATSVTGHRRGVVTIDLTEHDDARRRELRKQFGEPYRTLLGHLRHEIGHYYWTILIERAGRTEAFRRHFGDERADYTAALAAYYERERPAVDPNHISDYASSHPLEDWAETFAHYLHICDTLETASAVGLHLDGPPGGTVDVDRGFAAMVEAWVPLVDALNAVSRSMGERSLYPFVLTAPVVAKLAFVHHCIENTGPA